MKELITSIKGFVSYSLVRTADGGFSVSVYQDKVGADERMKAREWIGQNASATGAYNVRGLSRSACLRDCASVRTGGREPSPFFCQQDHNGQTTEIVMLAGINADLMKFPLEEA